MADLPAITDVDVLREFAAREQRWLRILRSLREFQHSHLGRTPAPVRWMAGAELGRCSWLGFYWQPEMCWFGYGLNNGVWQPLIEADNRSTHREVWSQLRGQIGGSWDTVVAAGALYCRMWAPTDVAADLNGHLNWFKERSRELHEYAVGT